MSFLFQTIFLSPYILYFSFLHELEKRNIVFQFERDLNWKHKLGLCSFHVNNDFEWGFFLANYQVYHKWDKPHRLFFITFLQHKV